jgi:hypothetical protein
MTDLHHRRPCEFHLLRYVPDPVRNEYVHIGAILRDVSEESGQNAELASGPSAEPLLVQFTRDWRRVRCLDPGADIEMLEAIESELRVKLKAEPNGKLMQIVKDSFSLCVQISDARGFLVESLQAGMEELMTMYVEPPPQVRLPRLSGRAAIQAKMRTEFERAGVWDLLKKQIPASDYTRPGDPLKIDLGYQPNGILHMFHAVSLEPGVEMAKVLAFSAAGLRDGVKRIALADLELTAIIEPAARLGATDEDRDRLLMYRFGVETMEEHEIRVLTTSDLARVADAARVEMRV